MTLDIKRTVPILIHGDAAFAAQGVVAETFNLSRLEGYANGGTVHLIANNQIGFTTSVAEARSTTWASDLAKGFDVPIIHVNADDPEACLDAIRLAMAYRAEFNGDVVIDLVGYRRYGHNEADEPSYTQPGMYDRIARQPTARAQYAERLVAAEVVSEKQAAEMADEVRSELVAAQAAVRKAHAEPRSIVGPRPCPARARRAATGVGLDVLLAINEQVHAVPREFTVHPKLVRQIGRRRNALGSDDPAIEWGHAESLAFAALLRDAVPIRLTGRHGAWDVQPASPGPGRRLDRRDVDPHASHQGVARQLRDPQFAAERVRVPRLRVRLCGDRARCARPVGGPVRRLRERRRDRGRPVHHCRAGQVAADVAPDAPPAPWLRGPGSGTLEREAGALPGLRAPRGTSGSPTPPPRPSTSTSCGDRVSTRARPLVVMTPKSLLRLAEAAPARPSWRVVAGHR